MKNPHTNTMEVAVNGLMKALDDSPRANWPRVIEMALTAVSNVGYAEGYRVGARDEYKAFTEGAKKEAEEKGSFYLGEDKALANEKPTPDEALLDEGYRFIAEIARQIGVLAKRHDVTPGAVKVDVGLFAGGNLGTNGVLSISLNNLSNL